MSQLYPEQPLWHKQTYPLLPKFWQVEPALHGLVLHLSTFSQSIPVNGGRQSHLNPISPIETTVVFEQRPPFWQIKVVELHLIGDALKILKIMIIFFQSEIKED